MRYLVMNGDDFGMCHSVNDGVVRAFTAGILTQASIMAPAPWFAEAVELALQLRIPVGVHLTATCEWDRYRWGPLTGARSLCSADGGCHPTVEAVRALADPDQLEAEYVAQVERVLASGLRPQHVDVHMGVADDRILTRIAQRYGLPVQPTPCLVKAGRLDLCVPFDSYPGSRKPAEEALPSYITGPDKTGIFLRYLEDLPDGIHFNLCHVAEDQHDLAAMSSPGATNRAWARDIRVSDLALLLSPEVREVCDRRGIQRGITAMVDPSSGTDRAAAYGPSVHEPGLRDHTTTDPRR